MGMEGRGILTELTEFGHEEAVEIYWIRLRGLVEREKISSRSSIPLIWKIG
jgi:hypothetical protein